MSEQLNGDNRVFLVQLGDGSRVTFRAQWQGSVDYDWNESGGPWTPTHPYDDRRCHWHTHGQIVRRVAVQIAGQDYYQDALTTAFSTDLSNQGTAFDFGSLHPGNCNDCADRRASDFQNMRDKVNAALQQTIAADLPAVIAGIQALPGVVQVNPQ